MWPSDLFETYIAVLELGRINVQVVMGFPQSKNILLFDIHIVQCPWITVCHRDPSPYFLWLS